MLSLENLKSVFETSPVGTMLIYPDAPHFTIAYANEACLLILNTISSAITGKSAVDDAEQGAENDLAPYREVLNRQLAELLKYKKAVDKNCYPILDENGQVTFIVFNPGATLFDHQSTTILESITEAFYAVDHNWIVTYWNKEAENVLKRPRQHVIGKNLWESFPDAVSLSLYEEYHKAMLEKKARHFQFFYPTNKQWMDISVYPSNDGISVFFKDITQRLEADKQLKAAKQNYKNIFNLSPLPMIVYDMDTLRYLDVNQATINHYGYSREECLTMKLNDIRPENASKELETIIKNEIRPGEIHTKLSTHRKKNGELIVVETRGNSIEFGRHHARLVAIIDVTKTLAAEEAVKRSEQYFKALIQSGSELIAIIDAEGHYSYINSNTNSILGINPESYLGKSPYQFVHPDDIPMVRAQTAMLATSKRIKVAPFRFFTSDKQYRWLESVITDMRDDPAVGGLVTNSRDVTHRIEYEMRLKESIDRFNLVSKATSDTIFDWDVQQDVLYWGEGFRDNFGYEPGESLQYSDWISKIHPDEKEFILSAHDQCRQNKETRMDTTYRFLCADGTYKVVLQKCTVIYNENGETTRMLGSVRNITETVNHIKAIEAHNALLHEISWMQSHVVRAPLARLMGLLDLINTKDIDPEKMELFNHLRLSATELDRVIKDISKKSEAPNEA